MISNSAADTVARSIDNNAARYIAASDRIWSQPELGFAETTAVELLVAALRDEGFVVTEGLSGIRTAFVAEFGSTGPIVGFLGEYDALAGLSQKAGAPMREALAEAAPGHGCGHNLLGVGALAAAIALKDHLLATGQPGRVRYYGCPAEEGGGGKVFMARDKVFAELDLALTWHPGPIAGTKSYPALAMVNAQVQFRGQPAHASWSPHLGRSATDAMDLMFVGLNYMREHMRPAQRLHYAVTDAGGTATNVVQDRAGASVVVRSEHIEDATALFERVTRVAQGAAMMTDTEVTVAIRQGYSNVLLNDALEAHMQAAIEALGPVGFTGQDIAEVQPIWQTLTGEDLNFFKTQFRADPAAILQDAVQPYRIQAFLGTTDVGDVSWSVPTGQFWGACYASGTPFHSWQMVAQGQSGAAHKGMLHAAKAMAMTAVRILETPGAIAAIQARHAEATKGRGYVSPIPDAVVPPPEALV